MPQSATTPRGGSLFRMGGSGGGTYPAPGSPNAAAGMGPTYVSLNIGGADAANFMTGQFVTPGFVSSQMTAAQNSSDGRTQRSANMQVPGLVVS